jgi:hypothetical protein
MQNDDDWNDAIREWLEDNPDDDSVRRSATRYDVPFPSDESESRGRKQPVCTRRERERSFSRRWGWLCDAAAEVRYWLASWFTTEVMLELFRASYGLIMAALLAGIIYSVFYARANGPSVRTFPDIDELQHPSYRTEEGSPYPTEGQR